MANLNNIIAKVTSLISDSFDGDTVMLIEQHLPHVLKTVCKFVADTKPLGHEKLLLTQTVANASITIPQGVQERRFSTTVFTYPFIYQDRFQDVSLMSATNTYHRGYPVNSLMPISLDNYHGVIYYFIEHPYVYISRPTESGSKVAISNVYVTHYIYATIDQFPAELEDLLVAELVKVIQNEPNKQVGEQNGKISGT